MNLPHPRVHARLGLLALCVPALIPWLQARGDDPLTAAQKQELPRHFGFGPVEIFKLDHRIGPLCVADLNNDGLQDAAIANNYKSTIEVLLQRSEAPEDQPAVEGVNELQEGWRFERRTISVVWEIKSLELAEVTGDGHCDIVFFGDPAELVILPNRGDGTFDDPVARRVPDGLPTSAALTCGDLNGDGRTDVALLASDDVLVLHQDDQGQLGVPVRWAHAADDVVAIKAVDIDGDGFDDLAMLLRSDEDPLQLRLQTAAHRLGPIRRIDLPRPRSLEWAACLDRKANDLFGVEDVSGRLKRWTIDTQPTGQATHQADVISYPLPRQARDAGLPLAIADVDGDGLSDVIAADAKTAQLILFRQVAGTGLLPGQKFGGQVKMRDIRTFDADGDGRNEVYVLSADEQSIGVSRFTDDRLTFPRPLPITGTPQAMDVGALDGGKGKAVIAYVFQDDDEVYHFVMAELTGQADSQSLTPQGQLELEDLDTPPSAVRLVDINHDNLEDALVFVPYEPLITLLQQADGSFAPLAGPGSGQKGLVKNATIAGAAFADVDGDSHTELLLAQKTFVRALRVGQNQAWEVVDQFNAPSGDAEVVGVTMVPAGQSSPTDRPQLAMYDKRTDEVHLFAPAGAGRYELDRSMPVGSFDIQAMVGSLDSQPLRLAGDDRTSVLLGDGKRFAILLPDTPAAKAHEAGVYETSIRDGYLTHMAMGDLNHDGRSDLAVIEAREHFIEILTFAPDESLVRGNKFRVFAKKQFRGSSHERGGQGEPHAIHIADLTGDGNDDLILLAHDRLLLYPGQ